MRGTDIH